MVGTWYHGFPFELLVLRKESTVTQNRDLARVFSHKPSIVSVSDEGTIQHDGIQAGYLYRIDEPAGPGDVYPHPRSTMGPGQEWLTTRELRLELIGPVEILEEERLTGEEIAALRELMER